MSNEEPEVNPYELLEVTVESTHAEIRRAYRQRSLKVHPDRNPNNPDAAQKFHILTQAYELLLDDQRRLTLNQRLKTQEDKKARYATYNAERRRMQDELDRSERDFKRRKVDKAKEERQKMEENEKIMAEGRRMREEREEEARRKAEEAEKAAMEAEGVAEDVPPKLGPLDTTVKLKYAQSGHPSLTTPAEIVALLSQFGEIDEDSVVLTLKKAKSDPTKSLKKPKPGTYIVLVPFKSVHSAFAAVCSSAAADRGLEGIEIGWVEGHEPKLLVWLRGRGMLGPAESTSEARKDDAAGKEKEVKNKSNGEALKRGEDNQRSHISLSSLESDILARMANYSERTPSSTNPTESTKKLPSFSSFSETHVSTASQRNISSTGSNLHGLDFESLTLLRMRQAERERLEKEIREKRVND